MRGTSAVCWSLLLLIALLSQNVTAKGGRGGARGGARGASRGASRVRLKTSSRYGSLRVASQAAAAGAAARAAARLSENTWRNNDHSGMDTQFGNSTNEGMYSYRAWTSGTCPLSSHLSFRLIISIGAILTCSSSSIYVSTKINLGK
ncbi:hypothetical protein XENTR_v10018560 [Xenopus tropicalis]|uniref:Shadow of prion protein n=1 Tax=Xenopus tropicalis TaxID=8364 RepID=SPRN_XENTR|nr:RecName: Full=Shadow of prion protein; Short=Protein shadoo; Flags: Precursor [Xenopus tropicalis]KAE8591741.1 hypothetical protein XENTR_v10018560 [Xenopus tropicalis]CAJ43801.1 TPA: shadoo protein Sho [Xenopus tropicalis]